MPNTAVLPNNQKAKPKYVLALLGVVAVGAFMLPVAQIVASTQYCNKMKELNESVFSCLTAMNTHSDLRVCEAMHKQAHALIPAKTARWADYAASHPFSTLDMIALSAFTQNMYEQASYVQQLYLKDADYIKQRKHDANLR